ncbi:tocopherol cyclase family protein [Tannockella kyphosi]|uniref:tocopherol cyclase family protein n=1 Tax=Tannockella kyphosi TaxID=2899121 RepID=UPI0020116373|nr:tocopherol cyclase family protein [Tannockella kyphosi]
MKKQMLLHTTKNNNYFEGWYYRINYEDKKLVVIIGLTTKYAFIQLFDETYCYQLIKYKLEDFYYDHNKDCFYIGINMFNDHQLYLLDESLMIKARIRFYQPIKLKTSKYIPTIMGPFSYLSTMECNHGIIFMNALIGGYLYREKQCYVMHGQAYLEKDWGSSFPKHYIWFQANDSESSLFGSVAKIPFLKSSFQGVIFVYKTMEKEYLFASYLGARVRYMQRDKEYCFLEIKQGSMLMSMEIECSKGCNLQAPKLGEMVEIVNESIDANIEFMIRKKEEVILEKSYQNAGFEFR